MFAKAIRIPLIVLTVAALAISSLADTIRLKDGSIIKGKIVSFGGGTFVITMGEGSRRREMKFAAGEIDSIQFDAAAESRPVSTPQTQAAYNSLASPRTQPSTPIKAVPVRQPSTPAEKMKPIEWRINVTADSTSNGWTNSGWVVKKGQRIRIAANDGTVSLGKGHKTTASGLGTLEDQRKLLKNVPTGALIAVIGDDNNDFIYVGAEREFVATRDGALFLGINEGNLDDNSGSFSVKIEIVPDTGGE